MQCNDITRQCNVMALLDNDAPLYFVEIFLAKPALVQRAYQVPVITRSGVLYTVHYYTLLYRRLYRELLQA